MNPISMPLIGLRRGLATFVGVALMGSLLLPATANAGTPGVSVNQASGQLDPANRNPINFTAAFTDNVYGFTGADVVLEGPAGYGATATVTGGPRVYNIAVSGITGRAGFPEAIRARVPAGVASDASGGLNLASTSSDNQVIWHQGPLLTVRKALGQASPVSGSAPINFTATFSDPVEGFSPADVYVGGTTGGFKTVTVTGGPNSYNVAVTGMTTTGTVELSIGYGVASNPLDEPNAAEPTPADAVYWVALPPGTVGPTVDLTGVPGITFPTNITPIKFRVVFSAAVSGFDAGDLIIYGTAGGSKIATVSGGPSTYDVALSGMTTEGSVLINLPAAVAFDLAGRPNQASGGLAFGWKPSPTVTINQAAGQGDPSGTSPINFTVVFSTPVAGFTSGDVTVGGTAGGTKTTAVSGSGATYNVAVSGFTTSGTVTATIPAGAALDATALATVASTSADNVVTWVPAAQSALTLTTSAPIPPGAKDRVILWGQGFTLGVSFATAGANRVVQVQGTRDGSAWSPITTLTTDAAGHASFNYRPVTNLFYRAVFAGSPDLAAATSNQVRTVVRQLAVMRPTNRGSTKAISRNASVTFTTTVRPSRPELAPAVVTFSFSRRIGGSWQLVTTRAVAVDSAGAARTTYQFTTSGEWSVRSQAGPTPYNANSVPTPSERYSVR